MEKFRTSLVSNIYHAIEIDNFNESDTVDSNHMYKQTKYRHECLNQYKNMHIGKLMQYNEDDILHDILSILNRVEDLPNILNRTEICLNSMTLLCEIVESIISKHKSNKMYSEYIGILSVKIFDIGIALYHMIRMIDSKVDVLCRDSKLINMLSSVFGVSCVDILKECSVLGAKVPVPDICMEDYNKLMNEWVNTIEQAIKSTEENDELYEKVKSLEDAIHGQETTTVFLGNDTDLIYDKVRHYCHLNGIDTNEIHVSYVNCVDEEQFIKGILEKSKSVYIKDILSRDMSDFEYVSIGKLKVSSLINNIIVDMIDIASILYNSEFSYISALDDFIVD